MVLSILTNGHVLIEDKPGLGKTLLVKTVANALKIKSSRIQFTSDLLPNDVLGGFTLIKGVNELQFVEGPIFSNLIIADELNRASPRLQSAFLQAMEEREVTIERVTKPLPENFVVVATQNPLDQIGTNEIPESQIDRFSISLYLNGLSAEGERTLILQSWTKIGKNKEVEIKKLNSYEDFEKKLAEVKEQIQKVHLSAVVADYIVSILQLFRDESLHLSIRSGIAMANLSRAWAYSENRNAVIFKDVQSVAPFVLGHRLNKRNALKETQEYVEKKIKEIILPF